MNMQTPRTVRALRVALAVAIAGTASVACAAPAETACRVPPATSPIYAGAREQVAQTSRGPIGYYRFGAGTPILLVTGFRATLS